MIKAYYNEFDPKAAAWLRRLIINGDITPGVVDGRSITEVKPNDLINFDRVHFFAGVGTWDYCLTHAGYQGKIWTASLPCQPFSSAGKGLGKDDERHLLPHFLALVRECKPDRIFGEQVERAITHGWLDDLQTTMEAEGYAIGHCVLGAHSIGAPHIRQRLYWVADNSRTRYQEQSSIGGIPQEKDGDESREDSAGSGRMGITNSTRSQSRIAATETARQGSAFESTSSFDWIYCRDNKYRPVKPGIQPLVDGIAKGMVHSSDPSAQINANKTQEARAMRLKGYGNAIQAQTAIAFITAYMSITK